MLKLVGGIEMLKELVPDPYVAVENQEEYLGCRGLLLKSKGSQPYPGLPSLGLQCQKRGIEICRL